MVVQDVPVASDEALLAVAAELGRATPVGNGGSLIHDVAPKPLEEQTDLSSMRDEFPLHTDSTPLFEPHAYVLLGCVEADPDGGGESRVLHVETLVGALAERFGGGVVPALEEPVYPFPCNDPERGTGTRRVPVLGRDGGRRTVMYRADALALGRGHDPDALGSEHAEALAALEEVLADGALAARHALAPGEVLVLDNLSALHGRTAIRPGARRLLRRVKVFRDG